MNKYFFFDTACTIGMSNAGLVPGEVEKDSGNPLFAEEFFSEPAKKWEVRYDNGYPNVFWDPYLRRYRCYYTLFVRDSDSESASLEERKERAYRPLPGRVTALCYAESEDGILWTKPSLKIHEFDGSKDNNIVMMFAHGASVFLDDREQDLGKRYKMLLRDDRKPRRLAVSFSADGYRWSDLIYWPKYSRSIEADSFNFAFRDAAGLYHFYSRKWSRDIRVIAHSISKDFIHWTEPVEVLRGNGLDDQIYAMPVFQDGGLFFGLCSIFHDGNRDDDWDLVDLELAYSGDGVYWTRTTPGVPLIPRGTGKYPEGACDSGCIYASVPVVTPSGIRLYYMGGNGPHTNFRETGLCCAYLGTDRYCAAAPINPDAPSQLFTGKFLCSREAVCLTADLEPGGWIEIKTVGVSENSEAVKRFENTSPKTLKLTNEVFWNPDQKREVALEFRFFRSRLYALTGGVERIPNHCI